MESSTDPISLATAVFLSKTKISFVYMNLFICWTWSKRVVCCMDVVFIAYKILTTLVWRSVLEAPYSYGHHPSTNTHALYKEYIQVLKVSFALELWQP